MAWIFGLSGIRRTKIVLSILSILLVFPRVYPKEASRMNEIVIGVSIVEL